MAEFIGLLIGALFGLLIGLILLSIITLIFQWLWNTTVPDVFGLKMLNFGQSFKILLMAAMLFGGGTTVIERGHEVVPDEEPSMQTG